MIKKAIISVYDKKGIIPLAKALAKRGIEILSTGGTSKILKSAGIKVLEISDFTGQPEILGGRVKTLHPKIFAGILRMPAEIGLVIVDLYPFEKTLKKGNAEEGELIEKIDIGGVSLIRAAAKNYKYVAVVCGPADYKKIEDEIEKYSEIKEETRRFLARKAFERTSSYDETISSFFRKMLAEPELMKLHYEKVRKLRYGENPHQKAVFFRNPLNHDPNVTNAKVLGGKELSFNNMLDTDSALELCKEFQRPTAVFVKHNNPCGVASADTIDKAFVLSHQVDSLSAYGGVVALNRPVTRKIVDYIFDNKLFLEVIIAPSFKKGMVEKLREKQNLRILETGKFKRDTDRRDIRKITGGILIQTANTYVVTEKDLKIVTKKKSTKGQIRAMLFANKVVKHVMSNAIVLAKSKGGVDIITGIGAGQMSRVDSVFMACRKAGRNAKGSVLASDAFFPFPDAVIEAAKHGIKAIIHPGGSIRDQEVIDTANKLGIAMVFSEVRMFRH